MTLPFSITCPRCHKTSYSPADILHKYCGNCRMYHEDMTPPPMFQCDICRKVRALDRIKVLSKDASAKFGLPEGSVEENVMYCDDNPICAHRAKTYSHFTGKEWKNADEEKEEET